MNVRPKIGIDCIYFGMTMDEVRACWDDPERIETNVYLEDRPEDRGITWFYANGVELSFDSDDKFVLTAIQIESDQFQINDVSPVGLSVKELLLKYPAAKLEEEFKFVDLKEFKFEENEITFWANDDTVYAFTMHPEYDESGQEILWPKKGD